jgi:hypothetical protein
MHKILCKCCEQDLGLSSVKTDVICPRCVKLRSHLRALELNLNELNAHPVFSIANINVLTKNLREVESILRKDFH